MKKCKSCGLSLQEEDETKLGYVVSMDQEYCQRCFRLKHYSQLSLDIKNEIKLEEVLAMVTKQSGLVLWLVDLWDLVGSMKLPINRYLNNREIVLVATKSDLLPRTLSSEKIKLFLKQQLKENGSVVKEICIIGNQGRQGKNELKEIIKKLATNKNVILLGNANSGKSTLLAALTQQEVLVSHFPGTTPILQAYSSEGYTYYDTPGLANYGSCLQHIDATEIKQLLPQKNDKRPIYQIREAQSFALGGLVRIDLEKVKKATLVFYCANTLSIHRGKVEKADELWLRHYGRLLAPVIGDMGAMRSYHYNKTADKIDICINGLGFVAVNGEVESINVKLNENIDLAIRKGMI